MKHNNHFFPKFDPCIHITQIYISKHSLFFPLYRIIVNMKKLTNTLATQNKHKKGKIYVKKSYFIIKTFSQINV